jgi:hypothetical protein
MFVTSGPGGGMAVQLVGLNRTKCELCLSPPARVAEWQTQGA